MGPSRRFIEIVLLCFCIGIHPAGSRMLRGDATATIRINTTVALEDDNVDSIATVILSELQSIPSFNMLTTINIQLEQGGSRWEIHKGKGTTKDYFVGITKDKGARASFYRHQVPNLNLCRITGMIHDNQNGLWYEMKPNVEGASLVSVIPDTEIAPFQDPVIPPSYSIPALLHPHPQQQLSDQTAAWRPDQSSTFGDYTSPARQLFNAFIPFLSIDKGDTVVDIMVVWTHSAECIKSHLPANCSVSSSSRQNMMLAINFFLKESNAVLQNSGLHLQLRLAHGQRVVYQETTFNQALTDLQEKSIPSVQDRRLEYKADMVMLLMDQTFDYPETGIAFNNYDHIDAGYMLSVVAIQYTSVWYLPLHEIGHNFGCSHDRGTADMCDDLKKSSYGYRDPHGQFRTIMSYPCQARQCDTFSGGHKSDYFDCPLIPYFSNDRVQYFGSSLGGSYNDCAGQIERVQNKVANLF
ncbi:expressed unknown protein [Seminavis robusta]|uniref:Peptidase M12B domain-containing protein n=1 Tax=Seminavis robusta TaxID=568900 RepID=A0A9N8ET90_9STRA|nr:expressed unknown protein [Seminavis robusta]|eukprot:Sro1755_g295550.1 n/a (467) ;mRNA; f:15873-17273